MKAAVVIGVVLLAAVSCGGGDDIPERSERPSPTVSYSPQDGILSMVKDCDLLSRAFRLAVRDADIDQMEAIARREKELRCDLPRPTVTPLP